jgi:carbamate kinase
VELHHIKCLLERETVVIAEGGAGLPVMYEKCTRRRVAGVECVIDKDLASELLARELGADLFVMLTATDAVYVDWGKPSRKAIRRTSPEFLMALPFDPGSIGLKVAAACRFATATGRPAVIGAPPELQGILAGDAGTTVSVGERGLTYATGPLAAA